MTPETLNSRWLAIDNWCRARGINQLYAFFRGCNPKLQDHYLAIGAVNRGTRPVMDTDEPWIEAMEAVIAKLNA
jgi:hypothetical protein